MPLPNCAWVFAPGKHIVEFDFKYDGLGFATLAFKNMSGLRRSGTSTLESDGKVVATQTTERTVPLLLTVDGSFDIGADTGAPVDDQDYQVALKFIGRLDKLTIAVGRPKLTTRISRISKKRQQARPKPSKEERISTLCLQCNGQTLRLQAKRRPVSPSNAPLIALIGKGNQAEWPAVDS